MNSAQRALHHESAGEQSKSQEPACAPEWVEALAARICERRLSAAAIFFFESLRPLNFVASQTMHALAPLASLFVEPERWEQVATALEDRRTLELILEEIERRERERSTGR